MSSLTAEDLRRTKQIIPLTTLANVAEKHGFVVRNAKGSHTRYAHAKYPDITGTLISSTKKTGSQRSLSDAILEVQRRDTEAELTAKNKFKQAADQAAAERLAEVKKQLPHYVEAFYGQGDEIIVRDMQVPQIGFTLYPHEDRLVENKMRNRLDSLKRSFFETLNRSRMQYDIEFSFDKRTGALLPLSHSVYDLEPITLPPYSKNSDPTIVLAAYQARVFEIDIDHAARKEQILAKDFIDPNILVAHNARRGDRHNHVKYNIPGVDKNLRFTFSTFSNQRVEGDGTHSRISAAELEKLERTVASIEQRIKGIPVSTERRLDKVA